MRLEFFILPEENDRNHIFCMIASMRLKWQFLVFLFCFCSTVTMAQDSNYREASYPEVQNIPLKSTANENAAIRLDSGLLHLLIFLSPECPLCKNYSLVFNTLQQKFNSSVKFYGIVPGRTYTTEDVQRYTTEYKIQFPVWLDLQKELSNYIRATVTPEVVLINKSGVVVYRGAVDDWVLALGQKKQKPQQHYLEEAINSYLQNKEVLVKQTSPIGCLINEF
jgi:thioredoxin-related protein